MSSLDLYPTEQEELELLEPSNEFWDGIEDQPYEWNLIEAAHAAGIVEDDSTKINSAMEVKTLNTPTALSTLNTPSVHY